VLLSNDELRKTYLPRLDVGVYEGLATGAIFEALIDIERNGGEVDFESVRQRIQEDESAVELLPVLFMGDFPGIVEEDSNDQLAAERDIEALNKVWIEGRIAQLVVDIKAADTGGDANLRDRLVLEQFDLERRRRALMPSPDAPVNT
jgi:hypothetical protein